MPIGCRVELLGGLRLIQGQEITTRFTTVKTGTLLAYLALSLPVAQPRERLIDLFWPDHDLDSGRNNLSTLLSLLRRQLEPAGAPAGSALIANRVTVWLNPETVQTDVADFDGLCRRADREAAPETRLALWAQAQELVRGELLPECYEDWALRARERCRLQQQQVRLQRVMLLAELGQVEMGLTEIERALDQEPLDEQALRLQMRLLAEQGRIESALDRYERLASRLHHEGAGQPERETHLLAERLRSATPPVSADRQAWLMPGRQTAGASARPATEEVSPSGLPSAETSPAQIAVLPPALTRFFGRDAECADLAARLHDPQVRLLTLLGSGGAGKTRLAVETARRGASRFEGRVRFVSLADVPDASLASFALQNALQVQGGAGDPLQAIVAALTGPPLLLVLDNLEHLIRDDSVAKGDRESGGGISELVRLLLERLPHLTCLVTSRKPLLLEGEQEYPVPPLMLPAAEWSQLSELSDCASVALYVDRARLVKPDFVLSAHNAREVAAICRRLEGTPLAIEMAAAWAKTLPPRRVLERLERSLDMLVSRRRDLPSRHRSLRAVCEWSYKLLTVDQQQLFLQLCLFRGGWTLSAAEAVAGEGALLELQELQSCSLIQPEPEEAPKATADDCPALRDPRYRMFEPLRDYGLELLEASGQQTDAAMRHAVWCLRLAEEAHSHFHTASQQAWIQMLNRERDNLWAALTWCREHDPEIGLEMAAALIQYWKVTSALREGSEMLDMLLSVSTPAHMLQVRARALTGAATLHMLRKDYARATPYFEEAQTLFAQQGDQKGEANVLNGLANVFFYQQQYEKAREYYERSLALHRAVGHEQGVSIALNSLGNLEVRLNNLSVARRHLEEAIAIMRRNQDRFSLAIALGSLTHIERDEGNLAQALAGCREILPIFRDLGVRWAAALCLRDMGDLAWRLGDLPRAVTLRAASDSLRTAANFPVPPAEREDYARNLLMLRQEAGDQVFEPCWQVGHAFTLDQAVTYALSSPTQSQA